MRILLANTGHPATIRGGAEAAVLDLAYALAGRGHATTLVVHGPGRAIEESDDRGVRVVVLPNRNLYFGFDGRHRPAPLRLAWHALDGTNPLMAAAFGRILDRVRPDVVNTHVLAGLSQFAWREAARRGIPIVHYLHEYGTMCPRGSGFRDGRACASPCPPCRLLGAPRKRLSRLVDTAVGVSRYTLERHLAWGFFPSAAQAVLPNVFASLAQPPNVPRATSPILRLGYFGRLIPDKGVHLAIEAVRRLDPARVSLAIAGTGDEGYVASLRAAAPANVRFLGWTTAKDFYPQIDAALVPSLWPDPQPRVVFEAFMHGVPAIGARAGGIPEQIEEGRTGWLFDAGSADDLARVLAGRLADPHGATLPATNFGERLVRLDPERVTADYERLFAEAIAARSSRSGPPSI